MRRAVALMRDTQDVRENSIHRKRIYVTGRHVMYREIRGEHARQNQRRHEMVIKSTAIGTSNGEKNTRGICMREANSLGGSETRYERPRRDSIKKANKNNDCHRRARDGTIRGRYIERTQIYAKRRQACLGVRNHLLNGVDLICLRRLLTELFLLFVERHR